MEIFVLFYFYLLVTSTLLSPHNRKDVFQLSEEIDLATDVTLNFIPSIVRTKYFILSRQSSNETFKIL